MEMWRQTWRRGVEPCLTLEGLRSLEAALDSDDKRLHQGVTTTPPPLMAVEDWPCEGACVIGLSHWLGDGLTTVGEVGAAFANTCYSVDTRMGEPAAVRWFLNWADETPRGEMIRQLLPEVRAAVEARTAKAVAA